MNAWKGVAMIKTNDMLIILLMSVASNRRDSV